MRNLQPLSLIAALLAASSTTAHPSMKVFNEIRQLADAGLPDEPINTRMIGDLATIGPTTPVGQSIANILLRTESGESSERGYVAPRLNTAECKADTCEYRPTDTSAPNQDL